MADTTKLLRIQDRHGRGPFAPGLTASWADSDRDIATHPPIFTEFPKWRRHLTESQRQGLHHFGTAAHGIEGLKFWFSQRERENLRRMGFHVADASNLQVLCASDIQALVASVVPLTFLRVIPWGQIEAALAAMEGGGE
jgi:hypothetical protein